jgi:hypothetical protein
MRSRPIPGLRFQILTKGFAVIRNRQKEPSRKSGSSGFSSYPRQDHGEVSNTVSNTPDMA